LSFERLANRRSSAAEKSVRSLTADGIARISSRPSNQKASHKGILRESDRQTVGITPSGKFSGAGHLEHEAGQ
jgi:hypothetical protein